MYMMRIGYGKTTVGDITTALLRNIFLGIRDYSILQLWRYT
jgi:hypothetical protein